MKVKWSGAACFCLYEVVHQHLQTRVKWTLRKKNIDIISGVNNILLQEEWYFSTKTGCMTNNKQGYYLMIIIIITHLSGDQPLHANNIIQQLSWNKSYVCWCHSTFCVQLPCVILGLHQSALKVISIKDCIVQRPLKAIR